MRIDFNSDLGESFGAYEIGANVEIMKYITSASIACGFHAGDPLVMRRTVRLAKELGVRIGAHPGYPDLLGFGRRVIPLTREEARDYLVYQLGALMGFAMAEGMRVQHVKPHGALYNAAVKDPELAQAIAGAIAEVDREIILLGLPGSELEKAGRAAGIRVAREAFADRAYNEDGTLVSRKVAGSLITDPGEAAKRVLDMVHGKVRAITGREIPLRVETICLHSDTPGAPAIAKAVREHLEASGVKLTPLAELVN